MEIHPAFLLNTNRGPNSGCGCGCLGGLLKWLFIVFVVLALLGALAK